VRHADTKMMRRGESEIDKRKQEKVARYNIAGHHYLLSDHCSAHFM